MWLLITAKTSGRLSSDQPAPEDKSHNNGAGGIFVSNHHTKNSYITFVHYLGVNLFYFVEFSIITCAFII